MSDRDRRAEAKRVKWGGGVGVEKGKEKMGGVNDGGYMREMGEGMREIACTCIHVRERERACERRESEGEGKFENVPFTPRTASY